MKKGITSGIALFAALILIALSVLAGCTGTATPSTEETKQTESQQESQTAEPTKKSDIEETYLAREDGCRLFTIYWAGNAKLETSDVWMWWDGKEGQGYLFTECNYGFKCQVNVPENVTEVGFIVRKNCSDPGGTSWGEATKDYDGDRFAALSGEETVVYLKAGDGRQFLSNDGGETLTEITMFKLAGMISETEIRYSVAPAVRLTSIDQVSVYQDGKKLEIASLSSLNNEVAMGTVVMKEPLDISKEYEIEVEGYGRKTVVPTKIFDSEAFIEKYVYDGDDLGATVNGDHTMFKVWAPTASAVTLNLFEAGDGGEAYESHLMEKWDKGVWAFNAECGSGTYYTYTVTTAVGTQEAVDPYARAAGVNGNRGMVIDLSTTDPAGFENDAYRTGMESYEDAVIWEVHVRDFSNKLSSSAYPGKYLAFTETGLTNASGVPAGIDYVRELGITHIHLQPVYDYSTVDESKSEDFNWGYDPKNYNVPEGSYSTDPFHGEVRVNEFKQMVQAIHANGMGVVMDVVYNHTYDGNSNLNKIVPYYYYRYTSTGENSNGSGCGNETASERAMFRKYMVDSVTYWAKEYHIDGFRFDLMALHDVETMQQIEQALHAINPECLIYGEGWTGGTTTLMSGLQATQANIREVTASEGAIGAVSVFNDAIRDGLKGSVFNAKDQGYVNGNVTKANAYKVIFGLTGGVGNLGVNWSAENQGVINYTSCHDNLTLYDKLKISCPDATEEEIAAMNRLAASAVLFSRGTPFMLAGEEMMRSKDGDENSYKSSDEVNNIRWDELTVGSLAYEMMRYYKTLISFRNENAFLKNADVTAEILSDLSIQATYEEDGAIVAIAYLNPNSADLSVTLLDGPWKLGAGSEEAVLTDGALTVPACSAVLVTAAE